MSGEDPATPGARPVERRCLLLTPCSDPCPLGADSASPCLPEAGLLSGNPKLLCLPGVSPSWGHIVQMFYPPALARSTLPL